MDEFREAVQVMQEMYGHDVAMTLATVDGERPGLRTINAYYRDGAFYVTTYALSSKMEEISRNPNVALCHQLFVAHGRGVNLGCPVAAENRALRDELREVFCAFYDRHVNEADPNTCILRVDLTDALVFTRDTKYVVDFTRQIAEKYAFYNDIV